MSATTTTTTTTSTMSGSDMDTTKRRLAFQKSYSQEHGWRRRSLIEDAKFETVSNLEFQRRERMSRGDSLHEDEEVFAQNGDVTSPPAPESGLKEFSVVISTKEGSGNLSRVMRVFEHTKIDIEHIESRRSRRGGAQFDIFLLCTATKDGMTSATNAIRQNPHVHDVTVVNEKEVGLQEIWFPKHISELDNCVHLVTKFEPELDCQHPGFTDMKYRERRKTIADIAFDFRHGRQITRIEYTDEEIRTWGHTYKQLKHLFKTHACKEYAQVFKVLEEECGYSENNIPQLEDVSNFLKRKSGFQLRPVSGLLSARDFLASLAFRVFQCTQYVRHGSKPDHSPEPDCIHELLGHVPMLADPAFAQFSQELGLASLGASDADIEKLATLYWFTVEFGLCKQNGEIRAYGAGVLSSYGELMHALSDVPEKKMFEPSTTAMQEYQDETVQPIYFVVESFEDMMDKMRNYVANIRRPYEVRYDPYTQSLQLLNSKGMLHCVARNLRAELENLNRAIDRIQTLSMSA